MSMSICLVSRTVAVACALIVLGAATIVADAQTAPEPRVITGADGTIFVVLGRAAWTITPVQLNDADVNGLNVVGEVDGTLPAQVLSKTGTTMTGTSAVRLAHAPDGTLFIVQGSTAWGLVPEEVDDPSYPPLTSDNFSVLTLGRCVTYYNKSLDGSMPVPLLTGVLPFEAEAGIAANPCVPGQYHPAV